MRVASIRIHHPQPIPVIREDDPLAIWGKLRRIQRADAIRQALQPVPIDVYGVDLIRATFARREINHLPIRGKRCVKGGRLKIRELLSARSIRVHNTDLIDLIDVTSEHDLAW